MNFRFRFEAILRLNQQQKKQLEFDLARLAERRNQLDAEIARLRQAIGSDQGDLQSSVTTCVTQLMNAMKNSLRLNRMVDEKLQMHAEISRHWKKTHEQFESIRQKIESLESLKHQQFEAFRVRENRKQQQVQDDDTLRRRLRNPIR